LAPPSAQAGTTAQRPVGARPVSRRAL